MHDESESTKLLKLQQNERNVNDDFQIKKRETDKKVSELAER